MRETEIIVYEQLGGSAAVSSEDGDQLFKRIKKAFENDIKVILNFNNINLITSTFLNSAIGQFYGIYDSQFIKSHLKTSNLGDDDLVLLKRVVDRAKEYFKDKERVEKGIAEGLRDA